MLPGITDIGFASGSTSATLKGLSDDGLVAVGDTTDSGGTNRAFRWTASGGYSILDPSSLNSSAYAVSAAGDVVVGTFSGDRAFRWTQGTGMVDLGDLGGTAGAYGVNAAGDVVVGAATYGSFGPNHAFRWTQGSGLVDLGVLNGGSSSSAVGVDSAGNVIVGTANDGSAGNANRAFIWTAGTGMVSLGTLNSGAFTTGVGIDGSGTVVAGNAVDGAVAGFALRAFIWTAGSGMTSLGTLAGGSFSNANAISRSGTVVVGSADDANTTHAFRWIASDGMQTVEQWLAAHGVTVNPTLQTATATATNVDGSVVAGTLSNGDPFIARVASPTSGGAPSGGSGLMNVDEYLQGLNAVGPAVRAMPLRQADLVVHGAHGAPMQAQLEVGRSAFWAAGDVGATDRGNTSDYREGLAEIGYVGGVSSQLQLKVALGHTASRQSLPEAGSVKTLGTYVVPELIWQAAPGLFATFTGYYNDGNLRLRHGYLNAGLPDISTGEADTRTSGLRVRLDALNLWQLGGVALTPFASFTYSRTKTDALTETGGGFPTAWNAHTDKERVGRIGLDGTYGLSRDMRLTARLELAHRFGAAGQGVSGEVTGLFPFQTAAQDGPDSWLRLGAGLDLPWGPGRFATTFNVTSRGGSPAYWLATSYRVSF